MKPTYAAAYEAGGKVKILEAEVPWVQKQERRGECFMSAESRTYQYLEDGPVYESVGFHPLVKEIMDRLNAEFGWKLNVCFLNFYADQTKALGWHADDAKEIDQSQPIAVVSFGQPREIWWREKSFKGNVPDDQRQLLEDGSLFVMPAGFQDEWYHKIPKGDRVMGSRISLTYRSWRG